MKKFHQYYPVLLFLALGLAGGGFCSAAENDSSLKIAMDPLRFVSLKGDENKFQAIKWMPKGFGGGFTFSYDKKESSDTTLEFDGHVSPNDNDNDVNFLYKKGDEKFVKFNYKSLRKFYDTTGGVYSLFSTKGVNDMNVDHLHLDVENFTLEAGLGPVNDPDLDVKYERKDKFGKKSLINWTPVAVSGVTRNIGPTWEDVNQKTDIVTVDEKKKIVGVTVKAEQRAQFDYIHNLQVKPYLDTGTASSEKIRTQDTRPEASRYSAAFRGEKWILDDKTFFSLGYLFNHTKTSVLEQIQEFSSNWVLTNYSNPRQSLPSDGGAQVNEHIWTGNFQSSLTPNLIFISKAKIGLMDQDSSSTYILDTSPSNNNGSKAPDGVPDRTDYSEVSDKISRIGENLSLRYDGISHTSLYVETEMEQSKDKSLKNFNSTGTGAFDEELLNHTQKTSWTVGGRYVPSKFFNITTQVRQRFDNTDYDINSVTGSPLNLLDALKTNTDEAETKITFKPYRWIQNAFRFKYNNIHYLPRAINQVETKNQVLDYTYAYDLLLDPTDNLLLDFSYSHQFLTTKTLAGSIPGTVVPGFNSGVNSWLFSSSYSPVEKWSFINSVSYSLADNFQSIGSNGLSLGANFKQLDISSGVEWSPKKDLTIKPVYEYATYDGNDLVDPANYKAHIIELTVAVNW